MKTSTNRYEKQTRVMTLAHSKWNQTSCLTGKRIYNSFGEALKSAWNWVNTTTINPLHALASKTNGKVWDNRIYFNSANGAVYFNADTNEMGIKRSDLNAFNSDILNTLLAEKATQLQNLGINLR